MTWGNAVTNEEVNSSEVNAQEKIAENFQEATISIASNGYTPQNLKLRVGVPTKLEFDTKDDAG